MKNFSRQDARLTLEFLPLVASVRWQLWHTPFARLHRQWRARVQSELDQAAQYSGSAVSDFSTPPTPSERAIIAEVWRCAHAVRRAARLVPHGSCLTQAMALQLVLARRGQPCSVRIGVDRNRDLTNCDPIQSPSSTFPTNPGRFEAHAWVEWQGRVILGGDITRWKPLTIFAPAIAPGDDKALNR